jgi:hypothetical protein
LAGDGRLTEREAFEFEAGWAEPGAVSSGAVIRTYQKVAPPGDHGSTTEAKHAAEGRQMAEIVAGTSDGRWVDAALTRLGCEIVERR